MAPRRFLIFTAVYSAALLLSVSGSSLWTDEAFSAYLASHKNLQSFLNTLWHGDSSDLQTPLYYLYLYVYAKLFGVTEFALRAANAGFLLLFSAALIFTSWKVFRAKYGWLAVAGLPFIWRYAGEARAYMAVLACSTAAFGSLLHFLKTEDPSEQELLPWVCLCSVLIGSCFHMLFLLAAPPLICLAGAAYLDAAPHPRWRFWTKPSTFFGVPFLILAIFFSYTFLRGTAYTYPAPTIKGMISVAYELAGFSGFGPNRKFSLAIGSYATLLAFGAILFALGASCAAVVWLRDGISKIAKPLAGSCILAAVEVITLPFLVRQQLDARHFAALLAPFLFLYISLFQGEAGIGTRMLARCSGVLLGAFWVCSTYRLLFLPEYQRENYRNAIHSAIRLNAETGSAIGYFGDPLAAAYYGLAVDGPAPCFPLSEDCASGLDRVSWPHLATAINAAGWSGDQTKTWLAENQRCGRSVTILFPLDRSNRVLGWWPVLANSPMKPVSAVHGFQIATIQ